jgi:hypothetical protein
LSNFVKYNCSLVDGRTEKVNWLQQPINLMSVGADSSVTIIRNDISKEMPNIIITSSNVCNLIKLAIDY